MIKATLISLLLTIASAKNPSVLSPKGMTYNAGDVVEIQWSKDCDTGSVNIDLVDTSKKIITYPIVIASGVSTESGKYSWKVPSELKSASGYQIRVWGTHQPAVNESEGVSQKFTVLNTLPNAINTFTVISPSKNSPCVAGKLCSIAWNYPEAGMYPAMVDIAIYRVGSVEPIMNIATVSSSLKCYNWAVPNDANLLSNDVYVSVSGQGQPVVGPSQSNNMGGNSEAFHVAPVGSQEQAPGHRDGKTSGQGTNDKKDEKTKKDERKVVKKELPKPQSKPRIAGASKNDKNAASQSTFNFGIAGLVLAISVLSLYL